MGRRLTQLPPWVLAPQLFLACGWLRAATSHGIAHHWWVGDEVREFTVTQSEASIVGYQFVFDYLVEPFPVAISLVVLIAEFFAGLALLFNWRPLAGLLVGAFLNVNFMMAGVVNPSVFYLVVGAGIAGWQLDQMLTTERREQLAHDTAWIAVVSIVLLVPAVTTIRPDAVIEDPAPVLLMLIVLAVITTRSLVHRAHLQEGLGPVVPAGVNAT